VKASVNGFMAQQRALRAFAFQSEPSPLWPVPVCPITRQVCSEMICESKGECVVACQEHQTEGGEGGAGRAQRAPASVLPALTCVSDT